MLARCAVHMLMQTARNYSDATPPPPRQGLLPNLIKLAPAAGISWYVFEETKIFLGIQHGS